MIASPGLDLVLAGGSVIDGTGAPRRRADVGVAGGRIVAIGDLSAGPGTERIDATDRVVAPGWVDLHSHSDLTLLSDGRAVSKVAQGVTTEVNGNCGMGGVPLPPAGRRPHARGQRHDRPRPGRAAGSGRTSRATSGRSMTPAWRSTRPP